MLHATIFSTQVPDNIKVAFHLVSKRHLDECDWQLLCCENDTDQPDGEGKTPPPSQTPADPAVDQNPLVPGKEHVDRCVLPHPSELIKSPWTI